MGKYRMDGGGYRGILFLVACSFGVIVLFPLPMIENESDKASMVNSVY
jgi:hypothetical protein